MKKLFVLVVSVFMAVSVFAQDANSTGLTDKEVQNFTKYMNSINEELEKAFGDIEDPNYLTTKADYLKAEKILAKYGFTGANSVDKYVMLGRCIGVLSVEKSGAMEMFKVMGIDPMAAQKVYINQKDYDVVERNWDAIEKALDFDSYIEEDEQEDDDYQSQLDDMMSSLMGMFSGEDYKNRAAKEAKEKEAAIKEYQSYSKKFAAGKKDVGLLYKKYDAKNASKWKLMAKYKSTDFMPDEGLFFTAGYDVDNYFRFSTSGAIVVIDNEWSVDSSWAADSWEIYHMDDADDMAYEVVFHTKKGIIHFYWKGDTAVLENDAFKVEGSGFYSAG